MDAQLIFSLVILLFSVIIHEVAHGYAALALGDRTAAYEGRLTLNPVRHVDIMGTIVFPLITLLLPGGFLFGWAKPVPYNPYNFSAKSKRWGEAFVAAAGPLSNIALALIFGLFIRFYALPHDLIASPIGVLSQIIVIVNLTLAIFNLVPIPPLDGSKILTSILPQRFMALREGIERLGFLGVIIFLIFFWQFFQPLIPFLFGVFTGL